MHVWSFIYIGLWRSVDYFRWSNDIVLDNSWLFVPDQMTTFIAQLWAPAREDIRPPIYTNILPLLHPIKQRQAIMAKSAQIRNMGRVGEGAGFKTQNKSFGDLKLKCNQGVSYSKTRFRLIGSIAVHQCHQSEWNIARIAKRCPENIAFSVKVSKCSY